MAQDILVVTVVRSQLADTAVDTHQELLILIPTVHKQYVRVDHGRAKKRIHVFQEWDVVHT